MLVFVGGNQDTHNGFVSPGNGRRGDNWAKRTSRRAQGGRVRWKA